MSDNPLADWLREREEALREDPDPPAVGASGAEDPTRALPPTRQGLAPWGRPPPAGRRPRRLLAPALAPWALAAVLGALALTTVTTAGSGGDDPPAAAPATPGSAGGPADTPSDAALGAAAAVAVRRAATAGEAGDRRYVDLVLPEHVQRVGDVVAVTLAAVVLEGSAERWHTERVARFVVPMGVAAGRAVVLDGPWPLPAPDEAPATGRWEAAEVDRDQLARAIASAGYGDVEVAAVEARGDLSGVVRAHVHARAPAEETVRSHRLWVRTGSDLSVLGTDTRRDRPDERRSS